MNKEEIQRQLEILEDEYFNCSDDDVERINDIEYEIGTLYAKLSKLENKKESDQ